MKGVWRRVERKAPGGDVLDYVEVGACESCGRGVDRAFPVEYREADGELMCAQCAGEGERAGWNRELQLLKGLSSDRRN